MAINADHTSLFNPVQLDFPFLEKEQKEQEQESVCEECNSIIEQIFFCGSCGRELCEQCFLSDFDSVCYQCICT